MNLNKFFKKFKEIIITICVLICIIFFVTFFVSILLIKDDNHKKETYDTANCIVCKKEEYRTNFMFLDNYFVHHKCLTKCNKCSKYYIPTISKCCE